MLEVEQCEYCQRVLSIRQSEGLLAPCPIYGDVTKYHPAPDSAEGVLGGFPCQVSCLNQVFVVFFHVSVHFAFKFYILDIQGVSKSGSQEGLADQRTCLVSEVYRIVDESGALLGFIHLKLVFHSMTVKLADESAVRCSAFFWPWTLVRGSGHC